MCCRDQPSNADMKSEGSAGRPGAGLVEGNNMSLTLERQAWTLPTPITHSHTFTSPPEPGLSPSPSFKASPPTAQHCRELGRAKH